MVILLLALLASDPQLPPGASCEQVRALVAEYGYVKAVIWAREHGYSWTQIAEAKRCLNSRQR